MIPDNPLHYISQIRANLKFSGNATSGNGHKYLKETFLAHPTCILVNSASTLSIRDLSESKSREFGDCSDLEVLAGLA